MRTSLNNAQSKLTTKIAHPRLFWWWRQVNWVNRYVSSQGRVVDPENLFNWKQYFFLFTVLWITFYNPFPQNPADCSRAKKIVCNLNKGCGYGCQVHHVAYCMIVAYGTQRTLILQSKGWRYAPEGWEKFFLPLSETCVDRRGESTTRWGCKYSLPTTCKWLFQICPFSASKCEAHIIINMPTSRITSPRSKAWNLEKIYAKQSIQLCSCLMYFTYTALEQ